MKNYLFSLFLMTLFFSCTIENEPPLSESKAEESRGIIDPNDPNLDPQWNWELGLNGPNFRSDLNPDQFGQVKVWVHDPSVSGSQNDALIPLPWVGSSETDYKKVDGWELYMRNFGSPGNATHTPYFALYNKYTGTLSFFIYNFRHTGSLVSGFRGNLKFSHSGNSLLTFTAEPENSTLETFDPNEGIFALSRTINSFWIRLDFPIVGYHPNVSQNTLFDLEVVPFTSLDGTSTIDLTQTQLGGGNSSRFNLSNGLASGIAMSKSLADLIDAYGKLRSNSTSEPNTRLINYNASNESDLNEVSLKSIDETSNKSNNFIDPASLFKVVNSGFGLIKSFLGSNNSPRQLLSFSGFQDIQLEIQGTANPYSLTFNPKPNSPLSINYQVPIYNKQIGILNFQSNPNLIIRHLTIHHPGNMTVAPRIDVDVEYDLGGIDAIINPDIDQDLELVEKRVKLWDERSNVTFLDLNEDPKQTNWPWESHWRTYTITNVLLSRVVYPRATYQQVLGGNPIVPRWEAGWDTNVAPNFAMFEFKFNKKNYSGELDNEIVFQKLIPLERSFVNGFLLN